MENDSCPCVDQDFSPCQDRFSLKSLEQTMSTCFGNWFDCRIYQSIARGDVVAEKENFAAVILTVRQHDYAQLRPTGT